MPTEQHKAEALAPISTFSLFTLVCDWRLAQNTPFFHYLSKTVIFEIKASARVFCEEQRPEAMLPQLSWQCLDDIAVQQHCATGMLCVVFQRHCLKGDLKCKPWITRGWQLDDLQLPWRKVNDIITTIVLHFTPNMFFIHSNSSTL